MQRAKQSIHQPGSQAALPALSMARLLPAHAGARGLCCSARVSIMSGRISRHRASCHASQKCSPCTGMPCAGRRLCTPAYPPVPVVVGWLVKRVWNTVLPGLGALDEHVGDCDGRRARHHDSVV